MARSQYCAEAQGKGLEMLDLLVGTPTGTREHCESQAARLGLDVATFRKCLDAPETTARLEEDKAAALEAQVLLLPTLFIGHDRFDGYAPAATLRKSIDRALGSFGAEAAAPK
jgi:predicted DsbA family dithiol-disulfide isomerase